MKRIVVLLTLVGAFAAFAVAEATGASAGIVYNAIPNPLPPNVPSVGFEATSTSEFGDYVHLAGGDRRLNTVTVTMSDWALQSDYPGVGTSAGWTHPITLNVYSVAAGPAVGSLLATVTQTIAIPWRPAADPTCPGGTAWRADDGHCYNGLAFNASFDMSGLGVVLPSDIIVGVAYNTADYGATPLHAPGPYNSLNVGVPTGQTASVGSDDNADNVFWNTSYAPFYTDGGTGGVGIFRQDTGWTPYGTVAFQITASGAQPLKLDKKDISDKACKPEGSHATQLVNVHYTLVNDYDSGFGGNAWANDTIDRHLRIWSLDGGLFCAQAADHGKFVTFAGISPSGSSTVAAGITGELEGGYASTFFTGTFVPGYAVRGDLGTFDLMCTPSFSCPGPHPTPLSYFSSSSGFDLAQWGWIYHAGKHGTWLNQDDVAAADSGDIT